MNDLIESKYSSVKRVLINSWINEIDIQMLNIFWEAIGLLAQFLTQNLKNSWKTVDIPPLHEKCLNTVQIWENTDQKKLRIRIFFTQWSEACLKPWQRSMVKPHAKIVNKKEPLNIFPNKFIKDVWWCAKFTSERQKKFTFSFHYENSYYIGTSVMKRFNP